MNTENQIKIRVAREADAAELLQFYAPYVEDTAITFEYEVPSVEEFASRIRETMVTYPYLVAEYEDQLVGYAYVSPFKGRPAYDWSVETSIYVNQNKKKLGVGRKLYEELERILKLQNILNVNACIAYPEVEDEHLTRDSVTFHQHLGYEMVGKFHQCGYKFNRWYDMVWMEKLIGEHVANQPAIRKFPEIVQGLSIEHEIQL